MPPTVFISYSQSDARWKDRLALFLGVFQHEGFLHVWHDGLIQAGADWLPQIENAMAEARVAILLVSVRFLNSEFVRRKEVPVLMERRQKEGLRVIPVIVSACPWQKVWWLSAIQARPLGGRTLEGLRKAQQNEVLSRLAEEVLDLVEQEHLSTAAKSPKPVAQPPGAPVLASEPLVSRPVVPHPAEQRETLPVLRIEEAAPILAPHVTTTMANAGSTALEDSGPRGFSRNATPVSVKDVDDLDCTYDVDGRCNNPMHWGANE
jgi:TIR domain